VFLVAHDTHHDSHIKYLNVVKFTLLFGKLYQGTRIHHINLELVKKFWDAAFKEK
jgi:hypothetical protein